MTSLLTLWQSLYENWGPDKSGLREEGSGIFVIFEKFPEKIPENFLKFKKKYYKS